MLFRKKKLFFIQRKRMPINVKNFMIMIFGIDLISLKKGKKMSWSDHQLAILYSLSHYILALNI